jgi:mono/diheme cytochrome c family protein
MLRFATALLIVILIVVAAFLLLGSHSEIPPIQLPAQDSFDVALVARGAQLAAIGDCRVCHTREGGERFAGARAVPTPFGIIFSTNITPDPETGIGKWSEAAFQRAMREGIGRTGQQLYPAFPYDHFTHVADDDNRALYAYLMTRKAVRAPPTRNELPIPLAFRPVIAAWKALYFKSGPLQSAPNQSAEWNRGAYLVEGLGHCGACHTPRNSLGAERADRHYAGGRVEGWDAYALDVSAPAPIPWTAESLQIFLQKGWHRQHGIAHAAMAEVTDDLGTISSADARAMAVFMASQTNLVQHEVSKPEERSSGIGAQIVEATCASCHDGSRALPFGGIDFALSTAVNAPSPRNLINVTLLGLAPPDGQAGAIMPSFDGAMSDAQLAAVLEHLRARYSDQAPWRDISGEIRAARRDLHRRNGSS